MNRKGSTSLTLPIILVFFILFIIWLVAFIITSIIPFIYYQKIDAIATKYMFVIEKFGYLTSNEKGSLLNELSQIGIDLDRVTLEYPMTKQEYGRPIEFSISYTHLYDLPTIINSNFFTKRKETIISVKKNSFSKIY